MTESIEATTPAALARRVVVLLRECRIRHEMLLIALEHVRQLAHERDVARQRNAVLVAELRKRQEVAGFVEPE